MVWIEGAFGLIKKVGTSKWDELREGPNRDEVLEVSDTLVRLKMEEVTEEVVVLMVVATEANEALSGGLPSSALMVALLS